MLLDEQENGSVFELEPCNTTFLENDFSKQSEIWQDLSLFKTHYQDVFTVKIPMHITFEWDQFEYR